MELTDPPRLAPGVAEFLVEVAQICLSCSDPPAWRNEQGEGGEQAVLGELDARRWECRRVRIAPEERGWRNSYLDRLWGGRGG